MAAVHIFIFGEMAGFTIALVPFIATLVKMKKKKKMFMELCNNFVSQSELANLHENN